MKDFPVFPTEFGAASLILKEIPYKQTAYIRIQDSQEPQKLVEECVSFCKMCGAEKIYAAGHSWLERYPLHCVVWEMTGVADLDGKTANLFPVTEQTAAQWRQISNEKLRNVDNAATLEQKEEEEIVRSGGAYFVHENGELLGIGWMDDDRLLQLAAVRSGAGEIVLRTLQTLLGEDRMHLEVASTNERALRLYERMGFIKTREISRWYKLT